LKLNVYVLGTHVAVLESVGDFKSVLTYLPEVSPNNLVSLTMHVQTESHVWDDQLHPIFQMNLPEGYLLQVLQEEFGPTIGASPLALLSVVGRNMIGRLQVAPPGASVDEAPKAIDVADLLQGDNSEEAFSQLVREHARSGVSGILPKFLDTEEVKRASTLGPHKKATLFTHRHIVKGSSSKLPFATVNEYLCMEVAKKVIPSAKTELSLDGKLLVVHRFDTKDGVPQFALEDFCALLGLRPAQKYETTWERLAKAVRDHVRGEWQHETFTRMTAVLLLSYALRNADCHSKNLALLYSSANDAHLAPAYDFLTTCVYAGYQHNPPAISFSGKKTWQPGRNLARFVAATFGVTERMQGELVERISDALSDTVPIVRQMMRRFDGFEDTGARMLLAWNEGVNGLRERRVYNMTPWQSDEMLQGLAPLSKLETNRTVIGRSPLLANRSKRRQQSS
jgi:serine/threonine-protein kinase HipA